MDQYYEGILQVRPAKPEIVAFIQRVLAKEEKKKPLLADIKERKEGVDFYFASNTFLIALGKKLTKEFGGKTVLSKKLHTKNRHTGKLVYRLTLLFRAPLFSKGMFVLASNDVAKITSVGKEIHGKSIISGKRVLLKDPKQLETAMTIVVTTHPVVQVLHPTTYQPVAIANDCKVKQEDVIEIVLSDNHVYAVP